MTAPGKAARRHASPAAPKPAAPAAPAQVLPEPREAPPTPRDPRFAHPLFVALAVLTSRWRFYARFKGAALDTASPFYAVACALAALDAMLGAWDTLASSRTRALLRAIKEDRELAGMIVDAAPSPHAIPVDEEPLFTDLRALRKRWSEESARSPSPGEWPASEAWWLCYDALTKLLVLLDHWGSPAATLLFGFACDLLPPSGPVPARPRNGSTGDATWLAALRAHVDDVVAAGLDATAPPGKRDLGRRMARRHIIEAKRAIEMLFAAESAGKDGAA